jgi:hypothetical protein
MFERHGTALSYVEFEDLCLHELPVALSKDQVRRPDPLPRRIPPLHQRCQQPPLPPHSFRSASFLRGRAYPTPRRAPRLRGRVRRGLAASLTPY